MFVHMVIRVKVIIGVCKIPPPSSVEGRVCTSLDPHEPQCVTD